MSNSSAIKKKDTNGKFLFTTKTIVFGVKSQSEKEQPIIQPGNTEVKHFVEVALQFHGLRVVNVVGKVNRGCATFNDPVRGKNLTSWTSPVSIPSGSMKLAHVAFEHCFPGYEDVSVEVFEVPALGTGNLTPVKIDRGDLAFQVQLT